MNLNQKLAMITSTGLVTNTEFAPLEQCDCFKPRGNFNSVHFHELGNGAFVPVSTENRYFYDPMRNNSVVYIQAFGSRGSHGNWRPEDAFKHQHPIRDPRLSRYVNMSGDNINSSRSSFLEHPYLWETGWAEMITEHISKLKLKPNYLVLNAGI